jgi:transcriptional regulator of acetoin/glycerol metabolism
LPEELLLGPAPAVRAPVELRPGLVSLRPAEPAVVSLSQLEQDAIERALAVCKGNVGRAAKLLGMGRTTLYRRLAQIGPAGRSAH